MRDTGSIDTPLLYLSERAMKLLPVERGRSLHNSIRISSGYMSVCFALLLIAAPLLAQLNTGADAVESFHPGSGEGIGREPAYFPMNVIGLPDTTARRNGASVDPK